MALEQKLSLRLSQRLVMTPALQQAIKLLQMSTLELCAEVATELQENPALEESQDGETPEEAAPVAEAASSEGPGVESPAEEAAAEAPDALDEVDLEYMLQNYYDSGGGLPRGSLETLEDGPSWENSLTRPEDLASHLSAQLDLSSSDAELLEAGRAIIGNLDSGGYLRASLEEIAAMGDWPPAVVGRALELVQGLDPAGVGARDLRECLLLQLRQRGLEHSPAASIVRDHLDLLQGRRYAELGTRLGLDPAAVRPHLDLLRTLNPRPGERFGAAPAATVIPDVLVARSGDGYQVLLNDDGAPRLRVSRYCRALLRAGSGASREDREFVRDKLNAAVRLIKSIEERQRTIYRVAVSIVAQQRDFLDHGIGRIRPLVLRDVAADVGVHESTVSRVVNNKYMHTPHGVFEMRYFFHSGLTNDFGEDVSSLTIKDKIRRLIEAEDPRHPLSDSVLASQLKQEAQIPIARRTVAKYREELRIPASTLRRRALLPG